MLSGLKDTILILQRIWRPCQAKKPEEYFKVIDDEIESIMRRGTWDIFKRKSVADLNVLPETWSFKYIRKPDWTIRKFKARYGVRGDIQK